MQILGYWIRITMDINFSEVVSSGKPSILIFFFPHRITFWIPFIFESILLFSIHPNNLSYLLQLFYGCNSFFGLILNLLELLSYRQTDGLRDGQTDIVTAENIEYYLTIFAICIITFQIFIDFLDNED